MTFEYPKFILGFGKINPDYVDEKRADCINELEQINFEIDRLREQYSRERDLCKEYIISMVLLGDNSSYYIQDLINSRLKRANNKRSKIQHRLSKLERIIASGGQLSLTSIASSEEGSLSLLDENGKLSLNIQKYESQ